MMSNLGFVYPIISDVDYISVKKLKSVILTLGPILCNFSIFFSDIGDLFLDRNGCFFKKTDKCDGLLRKFYKVLRQTNYSRFANLRAFKRAEKWKLFENPEKSETSKFLYFLWSWVNLIQISLGNNSILLNVKNVVPCVLQNIFTKIFLSIWVLYWFFWNFGKVLSKDVYREPTWWNFKIWHKFFKNITLWKIAIFSIT